MRNDIIIKYLGGGLLAVAFVGGVVWLIRTEAERTREAIREASKEAGSEVRKGIVEGAERAVDKAAELPGKAIRDVKDELPEGLTEAAGHAVNEAAKLPGKVIRSVQDEVQENLPETARRTVDEVGKLPGKVLGDVKNVVLGPPDQSKPEESPEQMPAADAPASDTPSPDEEPESAIEGVSEVPGKVLREVKADSERDPADVVGELFELGHQISKSVDEIAQRALGLSVEEEMRLGREVHKLIRRDCRILRSSRVEKRLGRLARPLLALRERKEIKYTLLILDDETVNAFSHVGGYIYANKGLLEFVESDAELQFVLGHEIGHMDLKHCTRRITYAGRMTEVGGEAGFTLAQLAYMVVALGYSEENEFEADAWSFRSMLRIGRGREEALAFPRHFLKYVQKKGLESQPAKPENVIEVTAQEINNHFQTHPPMQQRLKRLETLKIETTEAR